MLFFLITIVLILGIGLMIWSNNTSSYYDGIGFGIGVTLFIIAAIAFIISIIILCCQHFGVSGQIAANEQRYESLTYQLENNLYDNENDLGKRNCIIKSKSGMKIWLIIKRFKKIFGSVYIILMSMTSLNLLSYHNLMHKSNRNYLNKIVPIIIFY